ncbi:MAG: Alpha/beta hydrolase family protein [Acidobacteria bacterium]|nr:Alpha/beta hydrolase family protein [Acidobacteriota bacterium]
MRGRSWLPVVVVAWLALVAWRAPFVAAVRQAPAAPAAGAFTVLDPQPPAGPRITGYLRYQLDRAWEQDAARLADWAAVRSESDLQALKRRTRERLLAAIGGLPAECTPLNARVVGAVPGQGYRIEKVIFESVPGLHVTSLLYVPDGPAAPHPAVLLACGHSPEGKAFRNYQEIAVRLARRGHVVLCWDPVGQGERSQFWDGARGRSRYNLICGEHAVLGNLACLAGANLARWEVWDGMRAADYLLTRPEVDGRRLAITGTSGGGFQAATIGALDERLAVVAPSCFITSLPMRMANRIFEDPDSDPEQDPYGSVSGAIDHPGLLLLVHPRPLVVAAAVKDFVPIEGARRTFREISSIYRRFGGDDRVALTEGFHEHRFSDENQDAVFAFLGRFTGLPVRHGFEPFTPLPADALRCTPSGQVRVDVEGDRPLTEIIREYCRAARGRAAASLAGLYRAGPHPAIDARPVVRWNGAAPRDSIAWESAGSTAVGEVRIDRYVLHHGGTLAMPLLHLHAADATQPGRPVVLDVGLDGKAAAADWPLLRKHLDAGFDVVSFDLRGTGETRMRYRAASSDDPTLAPADEAAAYADPLSGVLANHVYNALLTGRPYFLEMLEDVEIAARFSRVQLGAGRVVAAGRGEAGLLARSAGQVLRGVEWLPAPGVPVFSWPEAVESLSEDWPIQYLFPAGALLR